MKTKFIPALIYLLCFSLNTFSQFIPAGVVGANDFYFDLIPDISIFAVDPNGSPYYGFPSNSDTILINLNGDNLNDFEIITTYLNGDKWYQQFYSRIIPLNNNYVAISHFDSCFDYQPPPELQYTTPIVKPFPFNDTIDKNSIWIDSTAYFAYEDIDAHYIACNHNSFSMTNVYAGLKVIIPNDTLYGWIQVEAPKYDSLIIKKYACNRFSTGIPTYLIDSLFNIFPNPTSNKFIIISDNIAISHYELDIYDDFGQVIYSTKVKTSTVEIDLSTKPVGLYLIRIKTAHDILIGKIIKE